MKIREAKSKIKEIGIPINFCKEYEYELRDEVVSLSPERIKDLQIKEIIDTKKRFEKGLSFSELPYGKRLSQQLKFTLNFYIRIDEIITYIDTDNNIKKDVMIASYPFLKENISACSPTRRHRYENNYLEDFVKSYEHYYLNAYQQELDCLGDTND
jgi:hypothetical protein